MADDTTTTTEPKAKTSKKSKGSKPKAKYEPKKTECPVTRKQFNERAKNIAVKFGDDTKIVQPKEFKTGSFGWYLSEKAVVEVDGEPCRVQLSVMAIVIGSADAK